MSIDFYKIDDVKHVSADKLLSIKAIANGPNKNDWYSLDLRGYKVVMPEKGCFVSVKVSYKHDGHPVSDAFVDYVAPTGELILPPLDKKGYMFQERAPGKQWKRVGYSNWYGGGFRLELDSIK